MITDKVGNRLYGHWDSLAELNGDDCDPRNQNVIDGIPSNGSDTNDRWWGIIGGWSKVQSLVNDGWPEGVERGSLLMDKVALPNVPSVRRKKVRRDHGDFLDIHRVYAGDLAHAWQSSIREAPPMSQGANATVVVDVCASARQKGEELFWNGATACSVVNALQMSGRSCQVIVTATANYGSTMSQVSLVVKKFSDPMDIGNLFSTIALAGFFRGYIFKAYACMPVKVPFGLGTAVHDEHASPLWPRSDTVIWIQECWNKAKAEACLNDVASRITNTKKASIISYG